MDKIVYSCGEHIEDALDDIIDAEETFPIMEESTIEKCFYCNKESIYKLKIKNNI